MILNTFVSGPQAWFFVADERGYFAEEGLKIDFIPGDTAANAVPRVARGEFDVGYGDFNALIELADRRGPVDALAVYATFTASPYAIAVPAEGPVRAPADLAGRRLGAHPNDAAMLMWPEFAAALIGRAKRLPRVPAAAELFDARFLPPPAERIRTPALS